MDIQNNILREFKSGDSLTKLLLINGAAFLLLWVIEIIASISSTGMYSFSLQNIAAPTALMALLKKPWTIVTYMFFDTSFINLMCNMLLLFWFGRILVDITNERKLTAMYVLGGFSGVLLPVLVGSTTNASGLLLSPIASILAVIAATATYAPNYRVFLLLFGEVSIKILAIIIVAIELLPMIHLASQSSPQLLALSLCKLGGVAFGVCWALCYKKGTDIAHWFEKLLTQLTNSNKTKNTFTYTRKNKRNEEYVTYEEVTKTNQEEIDRILKKIAESGYNSLTKEEKETLFKNNK